MKLLLCPLCKDIVKLTLYPRHCGCRRHFGCCRADLQTVTVTQGAEVVHIDGFALNRATEMTEGGRVLRAWVMPADHCTIKRTKDDYIR
jgi:hypothetical protein